MYEPERAVSARHSFAREGRNLSIPLAYYRHRHRHRRSRRHRRRRRRHHHLHHTHHHHHHPICLFITGSASAGKEGFEDGEGAQKTRIDGGSGGHHDDEEDHADDNEEEYGDEDVGDQEHNDAELLKANAMLAPQ